jgi:uncharacterized protein (TIGR02246 family)
MHRVILRLALAALLTAFVTGARAGDIEDINKLNEGWLAAIVAKDAGKIAALYTDDGYFMAPNAPRVEGRAGIQRAWVELMKLPNLTLTFSAIEIVVSESGDMALDVGTYELGLDTDQGRANDNGKYVIVWRKVAGQWLVKADIFNSSLSMQ